MVKHSANITWLGPKAVATNLQSYTLNYNTISVVIKTGSVGLIGYKGANMHIVVFHSLIVM